MLRFFGLFGAIVRCQNLAKMEGFVSEIPVQGGGYIGRLESYIKCVVRQRKCYSKRPYNTFFFLPVSIFVGLVRMACLASHL